METPQIVRQGGDHCENILGEKRLLLTWRTRLLAADAGHDIGDMPVLPGSGVPAEEEVVVIVARRRSMVERAAFARPSPEAYATRNSPTTSAEGSRASRPFFDTSA